MSRRTLFLLLLCLGATACAYTPPKPLSQHMEDYALRATTGAITVAATPFTSKDKLKDTLTSGDAYLDNQVLPTSSWSGTTDQKRPSFALRPSGWSGRIGRCGAR